MDPLSLVQYQVAYNNAWNAEQAQKQMDFQERMSNTAHQREVQDLKAAGLNPILSANQGASSPSGAAAAADPSSVNALVEILTKTLGIASDNAKAVMNFSGYDYGTGKGKEPSWSDSSTWLQPGDGDDDIYQDGIPRTKVTLPAITANDAKSFVQNIPVLRGLSNVISGFYNGMTDNEMQKYDNGPAYGLGKMLGDKHRKNPYNDIAYRANQQAAFFKDFANNAKKVAKGSTTHESNHTREYHGISQKAVHGGSGGSF